MVEGAVVSLFEAFQGRVRFMPKKPGSVTMHGHKTGLKISQKATGLHPRVPANGHTGASRKAEGVNGIQCTASGELDRIATILHGLSKYYPRFFQDHR